MVEKGPIRVRIFNFADIYGIFKVWEENCSPVVTVAQLEEPMNVESVLYSPFVDNVEGTRM